MNIIKDKAVKLLYYSQDQVDLYWITSSRTKWSNTAALVVGSSGHTLEYLKCKQVVIYYNTSNRTKWSPTAVLVMAPSGHTLQDMMSSHRQPSPSNWKLHGKSGLLGKREQHGLYSVPYNIYWTIKGMVRVEVYSPLQCTLY